MGRLRRWCLVALVATTVVCIPIAVRSLPARAQDVSAAALLEQARTAVDGTWSGEVVTEGTLQLPDADRFGQVAALFGEQTALRAWWLDASHWRVDRLLLSGETDIFKHGDTTVEWSYERTRATVSHDPDIRLPRPGDLLPPVLAERLLRGVTDADVTRLPERRVAGRSTAGLRVRPPSELSSIDHVDLWVDGDSGVPLLVEVYAGTDSPAFTSRFTDFSARTPDADVVAYRATRDADVEYDDVLDIADAANQYAPVRPPPEVAGLAASAASDRAVGVYGEGTAQVIAIPLRDREATALRTQMMVTPGADRGTDRVVVTLGPLGILLTGSTGDGGWLLAGTLTRDALERAARDVVAGFTFVDGFDD